MLGAYLVLFALGFSLTRAAAIVGSTNQTQATAFNYSTVPGFFLQDDLATNASSFDYTTVNFGLLNRTYPTDVVDPFKLLTQWQRFNVFLAALNAKQYLTGFITGSNIRYKLFFLARHGEGFHNVAEAFYGTAAWDDYWSKLDGNGTISWYDAALTDNGIAQAAKANAFWKKEVKEQKITLPQAYYSSPLRRCLDTAKITWEGLAGANKFVIKERLREAIGVHTCDARHNKTWIHDGWPAYKFEQGFSIDDPFWTPDVRETDDEVKARLSIALDDIVEEQWNKASIVAFSSHSGALGQALSVLGHRKFSLVTGAVLPVLVKVEKVKK